jgi:hypothetical protein
MLIFTCWDIFKHAQWTNLTLDPEVYLWYCLQGLFQLFQLLRLWLQLWLQLWLWLWLQLWLWLWLQQLRFFRSFVLLRL